MIQIASWKLNSARWFLRIGLAFVYAYAAVEIHLHPELFLKYVPTFVQSLFPTGPFLLFFGIFEVALTIWLLSGKRTEYAAMISFFLISGIVVFNLQYFSVLFRNIAIAFASLALVVLDYKSSENH